MGVWIETKTKETFEKYFLSHPVWVCGLKLIGNLSMMASESHTLYGCVD